MYGTSKLVTRAASQSLKKWNCRGIGNKNTQHVLKSFLYAIATKFALLAKLLVAWDDVSGGFWHSIRFSKLVYNVGLHGLSIWVLIHSSLIHCFDVVEINAQFVMFSTSFYP